MCALLLDQGGGISGESGSLYYGSPFLIIFFPAFSTLDGLFVLYCISLTILQCFVRNRGLGAGGFHCTISSITLNFTPIALLSSNCCEAFVQYRALLEFNVRCFNREFNRSLLAPDEPGDELDY